MNKRISLLSLLLVFWNGSLFCQSNSAPTNDVGIQYLSHVAVGVSDLSTAMHFYRDQLGFPEVFRINAPDGSVVLVYLRVNNDNFVELFPGAERQSAVPSNQTGLRHLGFFVKDLQATLHAIQARGFQLPADAFVQAVKARADGTFLCFIKDPDGNTIELTEMRPDSKEAKSQR
jgi:lactoylglutathione lyase